MFKDNNLNLSILAEECAEVIQRITKIQRFGLDHKWEGNEFDNRGELEREIGHAICLAEILRENGVISEEGVAAGVKHKREKLVDWYWHVRPATDKPTVTKLAAPLSKRGQQWVEFSEKVSKRAGFALNAPTALGRAKSMCSHEGSRIDLIELALNILAVVTGGGRLDSRWRAFSDKVLRHIEGYTVPQYGDEGDDLCSSYTYEKCIDQIAKYLARHGRNSRPGQDELDMLKAAHYCQMAHRARQGSMTNSVIVPQKRPIRCDAVECSHNTRLRCLLSAPCPARQHPPC